MNWKRLHNFTREQLQKVNPVIVRSLIRLRSKDLALHASERPTIVFSPHKDDEVLGCGGMIINKRRLGAKLYIVFMTDGCASHKSRFITPAALAELRTIEARECAKAMGVPEENLIFLEFEDGLLSQYEAEAQKPVAKILREFLPAEVFVPFRREAPADHRATYNIVRNTLAQIGGNGMAAIDLYEYFVWTIRLWFWGIRELYELDNWCRIDVREIRPLKKNALDRYRSQTTALYPDPKWATLPQDLVAWSLQPYEYYLKNLWNSPEKDTRLVAYK